MTSHSIVVNVYFLQSPPSAPAGPQRVAHPLLHLLPPHRRLLRPQHVCRRGRRELPQVPRGAGGRGADPQGREAQAEAAQSQTK